jgi:hypothetical protein
MGKLIGLLALLFVNLSTVALADCPPYDRKDYRHWIDADGDCQNARHEVLIEESRTPVTFKTDKGCRVVSGSWSEPYSGKTITDASLLDIDHLVPLKEAHESGGFDWDADRRRDYANDLSDPNTLIAVDRGLNRQKGAGDPAEWLPPNQAYLVEYAEAWVAVKRKWGLTADAKEIAGLRKILGPAAELPMLAEECAGTMVNPESVSSVPAQVDCQAKRYCTQMKICAEARAYLTQCNIQSLDRDGDGVPCEALCK